MNRRSTFGSWFWKYVFPHILVATVGTVGALIIPDSKLKLYITAFSIAVILVMFCCRQLIDSFRRIWRLAKGFHHRTTTHHQFVHTARDLVIKFLPEDYTYSCPTRHGKLAANPTLADHKAEMISIMECVVSLFENVVAENAKIWMSLRELRPDGFYHTFARAGRFTPPREHSSLPLHRSRSATIRRLRDSIDCQQCVLLTGSTRGPEMWTPQPNDSFGEDKCVLMGAVLIKAWDAPDSFKRPKLVWILTVCADRENAFDASHVPLMQSCVDVFSMIVNVMARHPKCITTHSVGAASSGVIHNTSIDVGTSGSPSSPVVHSTSSFNI